MTFPQPIYRRQASSGTDHRWTRQSELQRQGGGSETNLEPADHIHVDPGYANDTKTGYIREHDLSKRHWTGGRNK